MCPSSEGLQGGREPVRLGIPWGLYTTFQTHSLVEAFAGFSPSLYARKYSHGPHMAQPQGPNAPTGPDCSWATSIWGWQHSVTGHPWSMAVLLALLRTPAGTSHLQALWQELSERRSQRSLNTLTCATSGRCH